MPTECGENADGKFRTIHLEWSKNADGKKVQAWSHKSESIDRMRKLHPSSTWMLCARSPYNISYKKKNVRDGDSEKWGVTTVMVKQCTVQICSVSSAARYT